MFHHALVPLDGTRFSEAAISHADWLGRHGVRLTLVQVVPHADDVAQARAYLERIASQLRSHGANVNTAVIVSLDPAVAVADFADRNHVDLIIMATHSRSGLQRMIQGSTADQIMNITTIPVLLVRPLREVERPRMKVYRTGT